MLNLVRYRICDGFGNVLDISVCFFIHLGMSFLVSNLSDGSSSLEPNMATNLKADVFIFGPHGAFYKNCF